MDQLEHQLVLQDFLLLEFLFEIQLVHQHGNQFRNHHSFPNRI
jgi:hypothetical protein